MARFVSSHRNYSHGVRNHVASHLGVDGKMVPEQTELQAQFTPDLRTDEDTAVAMAHLQFRGLPIFENGQEVGPFYRISVFDSEIAKLQNDWTDEDEALVVETLRTSGPIGSMYVEVVAAKADKPWNGYDEIKDADRVVELALAIDADLQKVVQYERENLNRPEVLAALDAAIAAAGETISVSA
jgi:adenosine/AMP kinase